MKFLYGSFEAVVCLLSTSAWALVLDSVTDASVFTVGKCHDIVDSVNASEQDRTITICEKRLASRESCRLVGEMLAMAEMRGTVNTTSFCDAMSSAHMCSSAMEDFLSSEPVSDLAFGHCMRQKPVKTQEYCRQFQHVMSTAVKASESMDTLRECYMMELANQNRQNEKSAALPGRSAANSSQLQQSVTAEATAEQQKTAQTMQLVAAAATAAVMAAQQPVAAQQIAQAQQLKVAKPVATAAQTIEVAAESQQSAVQPQQVAQAAVGQPATAETQEVVQPAAQPAAQQQQVAQMQQQPSAVVQTQAVQQTEVAAAEPQAVPVELEQPPTMETQQVVQPATQPQQVAQTQQLSEVVQTQEVQQTEIAAQANTPQVPSQQVASTGASTAALSLSTSAAIQQPAQGEQSVQTAAATAATAQELGAIKQKASELQQELGAIKEAVGGEAAAQPQPALITVKPHSTEVLAAASSAPAATTGIAAATTKPAEQKLATAEQVDEVKVAFSKVAVQDASKASFLASNATTVPAKALGNATVSKEYSGFLSKFIGS